MKNIIVRSEYVIQGYLASSPRHPRWTTVYMNALNGWEKFQHWDKGCRIRDPRLDQESDGWVANSREDGLSILRELRQQPQKYYLRLVRVLRIIDTEIIAGADIEDGTIVDGPAEPASARDPFWRVPQEILDSIVRADQIKDIEQ